MDLFDEPDPWRSGATKSNVHEYSSEWVSATAKLPKSSELDTNIPRVSLSELDNRNQGFLTESADALEHSIWNDAMIKKDKKEQPFKDIVGNITAVGAPGILEDLEEADKKLVTDSEGETSEDLNDWLNSVKKTFKPLSMDIITVEELPDKEGILFKHTNYQVKHLVDLPNTETSKDRTVIRRYSDFVWLQDVLLRRYPFRLIPDLPPKKIGSQNNDKTFLERRRQGLTRFINLVMKHPVLCNDDLVLTFLTVPADLSGWRKQASYDTSEEFSDKKITSNFMRIWRKELSDQWNEADASIEKTVETWMRITIVLERYQRRIRQIAHERSLLSSFVEDFSQNVNKLYPVEQSSTIVDIHSHFGDIKKHLGTTCDLINKEATDTSEELIPKFRIFIDILLSLRGLFERYKIMATNNVPLLQRRVEINTEKLKSMRDKADASGVEYDRITVAIQRDKKSINEELNRAWLIRECILEEFAIFQATQFLISRAFQQWSKLNANYLGLNLNEWENLTEKLTEMPTSFE